MVVFETDAWHFRYFPSPKTETLSYPAQSLQPLGREIQDIAK